MAQARTNGKTEASDVTAQIETIKDDIAALTSLMADFATEKKAEAKQQVTTTAKAAQDQAIESGEKLFSDAEAAYHKVEESVRQQPAMAVGIAASLGFIFGMITARRD